MANKFRGEIAAASEGKTYTLRMDMNALAAFETETGEDALAWAERAESGAARISEMITMIHCALSRHHPEADRAVAGDILSEDSDVLIRLISAAAPDLPADQDAGNTTKGKRKAAAKR